MPYSQKSLLSTFFFIVIFFFGIGVDAFSDPSVQSLGKPYIGPKDMVTVDMMIEDFDFVLQKLARVHPQTIDGFSPLQKQIISEIRESIRQPTTKENFFFSVNRLFHSFHDAHTTMWLVFSQGIDLPLVWLKDGLYVEWDTGHLVRGDRIISVGGKSVAQLFQEINQIVWTENSHLVRLEGPWMLLSRPYLRQMGLVEQDGVTVVFSRAGRERTVRLPIIDLGRRREENLPLMTFAIETERNLAVLTLNMCRFDSEYFLKLRNFFREVREQGINNIALDLRRNSGGDSRVIDLFLSYLNVDRIKTYGSTVRYSQESWDIARERGTGVERFPRSEKANRKVSDKNLLFSGRVFVLTSSKTFSSANMFAVTLQDNRIATIIGEPTGNQPSCFGHPLNFEMPRTGIYFKISHKQFFRPESSLDHLDAVYPDVEIYRTIDDIIQGRDSQMGKIRQLIEGENTAISPSKAVD